MADQSALARVGLCFGVLTVAVMVIAAVVVKHHIESQRTADLGGSLAVDVVLTR